MPVTFTTQGMPVLHEKDFMAAFLSYFYYACALALGILTLFFAFKVKQAKGAGEMNEFMTEVGRGSFGAGVKSKVAGGLWTLMCLGAALATLMMISLAVTKGSQSVPSEQAASQPVVPVQPDALTPTAPVAQAVIDPEKKLEVEVKNTDSPQNVRAAVSGVSQNTTVASDKPIQAVVINKGPAVAGSDIRKGETNAIEVCESASNFFSKNNCRFEQCAKEENSSKPECEKFQKK